MRGVWLMWNKYHNQKTEVAGITFASKKEAERYLELKMMERAGMIKNLEIQKRFEIIPKTDKYRACFYVADFVYETHQGKKVIEDTKGFRTKEYLIKKKLVYARYGIDITEV